jgi:hypothetical protein
LLSPTDKQSFADFQLDAVLPPNPVRALNNSLNAAETNGRNFFLGQTFNSNPPGTANDELTGVGGGAVAGRRADGANAEGVGFTCTGCHGLDPAQGFFGADQQASFENEHQIVKVAHLRNLYQKVGMFGMPDVSFNNALNTPHQGNQVRGFGFLHDGSTDTVFRFVNATVFNQANLFNLGTVGFPSGLPGNGVRRDVEKFMLAFDSDLAPIVGQQVTLTSTNAAQANPRIDLLIERADLPFVSQVLGNGIQECDLVVKGVVGGVEKGWLFEPGPNTFRPDDGGPNVTDAALRGLATGAGQQLTYTCGTPGSGLRAGLDRDRDAVLDGVDDCPAVADPGQADGDSDGVGTACDNCAAKSNASQADTDVDTLGDVCDDLCIGTEVTSLAGVSPTAGAVGHSVMINGTGFGPSVQVWIGGVQAATSTPSGLLVATVPGLPNGVHGVVVVNPEGCQSQQAVTFQVVPASSCGLTGFELFPVMGLLAAGRRRLRSLVS